MMDTGVSLIWVDWLILAIILISALISVSRGFIKEAFSLLSWIVAGFVAWSFGGGLAPYFEPYIALPSARVIVASLILLVVTLLIGSLVNFLLAQLVKSTGLTGTDRLLGMVFGGARGVMLVVLLIGLLSLLPVTQDPWWQASNLIPHFLLIADWSKDLVIGWVGR